MRAVIAHYLSYTLQFSRCRTCVPLSTTYHIICNVFKFDVFSSCQLYADPLPRVGKETLKNLDEYFVYPQAARDPRHMKIGFFCNLLIQKPLNKTMVGNMNITTTTIIFFKYLP